jgi:nucleotide-binding universal stress UspA family protein
MFQRIMVTWDASDVARSAFDVAIDVARRYDGELVAVSVAYSPAHAETSADRTESVDAAHRYLEESFREIKDRADRAGIDVEHQIVDGSSPAEALLAYAHEHAFDLIVCGHQRTRRAGRLLLRGVAEDLFRDARTPVLVVGEASQR